MTQPSLARIHLGRVSRIRTALSAMRFALRVCSRSIWLLQPGISPDPLVSQHTETASRPRTPHHSPLPLFLAGMHHVLAVRDEEFPLWLGHGVCDGNTCCRLWLCPTYCARTVLVYDWWRWSTLPTYVPDFRIQLPAGFVRPEPTNYSSLSILFPPAPTTSSPLLLVHSEQ
jgi:hypothetical protein